MTQWRPWVDILTSNLALHLMCMPHIKDAMLIRGSLYIILNQAPLQIRYDFLVLTCIQIFHNFNSSHAPKLFIYMLRRKSLVSTDTVCNYFVGQSLYWQKPYLTWNSFNFFQMWIFSTKIMKIYLFSSSKLHKGVTVKIQISKLKKSV